jgi:hypothetical protein
MMSSPDDRVRPEVLPFARGEEQAAELPHPVRLTVTCSAEHGPDRSVELARSECVLGHGPSPSIHSARRRSASPGAGESSERSHCFTFNELVETWRWRHQKLTEPPDVCIGRTWNRFEAMCITSTASAE